MCCFEYSWLALGLVEHAACIRGLVLIVLGRPGRVTGICLMRCKSRGLTCAYYRSRIFSRVFTQRISFICEIPYSLLSRGEACLGKCGTSLLWGCKQTRLHDSLDCLLLICALWLPRHISPIFYSGSTQTCHGCVLFFPGTCPSSQFAGTSLASGVFLNCYSIYGSSISVGAIWRIAIDCL